MQDNLKNAIRDIVNELVSECYDQITSGGRVSRLSSQELKDAILEYGKELIPLPPDAFVLEG